MIAATDIGLVDKRYQGSVVVKCMFDVLFIDGILKMRLLHFCDHDTYMFLSVALLVLLYY